MKRELRQSATQTDAVNVREHGAVGDGIADDTAAFKDAIAALPAEGGKVVMPTGTYKITSTLNIKKPVIFQGTGAWS